jgi:hypothetical protein
MPGYLLTATSQVTCTHGSGKATPMASNPRVKVMQQPTVLITSQYTIAGCGNPPASGGPCATGSFLSGSARVTSMGQPLAVAMTPSPSLCAPTPAPMITPPGQTRVFAM